jgi:hypothetical protein
MCYSWHSTLTNAPCVTITPTPATNVLLTWQFIPNYAVNHTVLPDIYYLAYLLYYAALPVDIAFPAFARAICAHPNPAVVARPQSMSIQTPLILYNIMRSDLPALAAFTPAYIVITLFIIVISATLVAASHVHVRTHHHTKQIPI